MPCGRKIGPFDCCSVVQGDCLELMKALPDGCVDAVITDPMYGIRANFRGATSRRPNRVLRGTLVESKDWDVPVEDNRPFDPSPFLAFKEVVMWGGNHYASRLPDSSCWIVWDKRDGGPSDNNADCEMAWTNLKGPSRLFTQMWRGICRAGEENIAVSGPKLHPFQKPVALMSFCLDMSRTEGVILDPYMGSGSTLVAAKRAGRHFLGFELSPEYCDIARKRIALVEAQPNLFEPKAEQMTLAEAD